VPQNYVSPSNYRKTVDSRARYSYCVISYCRTYFCQENEQHIEELEEKEEEENES
jgi:hypothetical protein